MDSQLNFFDYGTNDTSGGGGTIYQLDGIPSGLGDQQRQGNKVFIQNINVKIISFLTNQTAASISGDVLRLILFKDNQSNGSSPTVGQVLQTASILSHYNWDNQLRFEILEDIIQAINPLTQNAALGSSLVFQDLELDVDLNDYQIYQGTTSLVITGQINLLIIPAQGLLSTTFASRLTYFNDL